jgi:hypothetical protein
MEMTMTYAPQITELQFLGIILLSVSMGMLLATACMFFSSGRELLALELEMNLEHRESLSRAYRDGYINERAALAYKEERDALQAQLNDLRWASLDEDDLDAQ